MPDLDCDSNGWARGMRMINHIAACESEALALVGFVAGLMPYFETGNVSKEDLMALFDACAGPNPPLGKLLTCVCCSVYLA